VLVPGALIGFVLAFRSPRDRAELAFAAFAVPFACLLVAEAAVYGLQVHERYLFYLIPLLSIAFALYARRGFPHFAVLALLAAGFVTVATRVPLSDLARRGEGNTPFLIAVHWLQIHVTTAGNASIVPLTVAIVASAVMVAAARRPRLGAPVALALAAAVMLAAYAGAADFDRRNTNHVRTLRLASNLSWVDAAGVGKTALLQAWGGQRTQAMEQLFWNRSVDSVLLLPGAVPVDAFRTGSVKVARDGTLLLGGKPVTGPLLVDGFGSLVQLRDARVVARAPLYTLWLPRGSARLALYFAGRYDDGWTTPASRIDLWPDGARPLAGRLVFGVDQPAIAGAATLHLKLPSGAIELVRLRAGHRTAVSLPVCSARPWRVLLGFDQSGISGERIVSAKTTKPVFRPDPAICAASPAGSAS
jgi:hypothetical protein